MADYCAAVSQVSTVTAAIVQLPALVSTPVRLRLWAGVVVAAAVAVLLALSVSMSALQRQARVIGDEAAPQAATASDLYFALSDLDTQVARLVLIDNAPELSGTQVD